MGEIKGHGKMGSPYFFLALDARWDRELRLNGEATLVVLDRGAADAK